MDGHHLRVLGSSPWTSSTSTSPGTEERREAYAADGTYYKAGTITQRGSPSGTGVKIQDSGSTLQAIITTAGDVVLTGDFADQLSGLS